MSIAAETLVRRLAGREVVAEVTLAIAARETVALVGPSGCGKTTLLQMLALLDRPDSGRVLVDDVDAWTASAAARAELRLRRLGVVFQQSNLLDHLTARDNVALPAWRAGASRRAGLTRADELLAALGLTPRANAPARALSIGEAQRVAVARALVNRPALVLADEPTGSLDGDSAAAVMDALIDHRGDASLLVVTHAPEVAARADRTVRMKDGRIV